MMEKFDKIFDLTGKTVVAVGGAGGIGGTVCLGLADFGANVVIVDLKEKDGRGVVKQIEERGGKGTYIGADCTKIDEIDNMVNQVLSTYGRIDINVNF